MPEKSFSYEPDGPPRLKITWQKEYKNDWKNLTIILDDEELAIFERGNEFIGKKKTILAPDGSKISLRLAITFSQPTPIALRDGKVVDEFLTPSQHFGQVKSASQLFYFLAGVNGLLGVMALAGNSLAASLGVSPFGIVDGLIFLWCGLLTQNLNRLIPVLGGLIYIFGYFFSIAQRIENDSSTNFPTAGIFILFIIVSGLWKGYTSIGFIRRTKLDKLPESQNLLHTYRINETLLGVAFIVLLSVVRIVQVLTIPELSRPSGLVIAYGVAVVVYVYAGWLIYSKRSKNAIVALLVWYGLNTLLYLFRDVFGQEFSLDSVIIISVHVTIVVLLIRGLRAIQAQRKIELQEMFT